MILQIIGILAFPLVAMGSIMTTTLTKMHDWDDNFEAHLIWNLQEEVNGWEAIITLINLFQE